MHGLLAACLFFFSLSLPIRSQSIPEFVTIGNPNNLPDTNGYPFEFGSVPYIYKISKYETKVSEYVAFLNSAAKTSDPYGLYGSVIGFFIDRSPGPPFSYSAKTGASNKPIGGVTWLAAARYANWLHNGGAAGSSTEFGAYDLNGATNGFFLKNTGARYWIPSGAEWYKAAYYDPNINGGAGGYWPYATRTNSITTNDANYGVFVIDLSTIREVGSYPNRPSSYGTFDQTGNLDEIVSEDSLVYYDTLYGQTRGGSLNNGTYSNLFSISSSWASGDGSFSTILNGVRLAGGMSTNKISIYDSLEFVLVANTNNTAHSSGYGQVGYPYEISKYEVTIEQYATFLNAVAKSDPYGLFDTNMESHTGIRGIQRLGTTSNYRYVLRGTANRPITFINWFRAARFANWLHNGATTNPASTETGAYPLNGNTSTIVAAATNALYRLPTENEWFKSAYFDPTNNRYWNYPTRSDTPPTNNLWGAVPIATYSNNGSFTLGNNPAANDNKLTGVGQTRSPSAYGTCDQGGNVWEWVDTLTPWSSGVLRGGSWVEGTSAMHNSSANNRNYPWLFQSFQDYGFRLVKGASTTIPTNSTPSPITNNPTPTNPPASGGPVITSFSPMEVTAGMEIDIFGSGFGTLNNTVLRNLIFSGGDGPDGWPSIWTDSQVRVRVPGSATTGPFTIFYVNETGITNTLSSGQNLNIISGYSAWKLSAGFTNDQDRPAKDGLSMMDRYFHGITGNVIQPASRPFSFSTTDLLMASGQSRPVLKFSRSRQAAEINFWIERATNLSTGVWQNVDVDVQVTTNPANTNLEDLTITDFSQPSGSRAFYRLGLSTNTNGPSTSLSNLPPIWTRNESVAFPKIFQPWEVATVLAEGRSNSYRTIGTNAEDQRYFTPRHNLRWEVIWRDPELGESFFSGPSESTRNKLLLKTREDRKMSPSAVRLAVIEYYEGETNNPSFGPPSDSPFWLRTTSGSLIKNFAYDAAGSNVSCLFDFSNPEFQDRVAARAAALTSDGLFDGVFLDCWSETRGNDSLWGWIANDSNKNPGGYPPRPWGLTNSTPTGLTLAEVEKNARIQLLQKIRNRIGTNKIIIANINYGKAGDYALSPTNPLVSGPYLDGVYMECYNLESEANQYLIRDSNNNPIGYLDSLTAEPYLEQKNEGETYWQKLEKTMAWVEAPGNLRSQGLNCFEVWHRFSKFDPRDLRWMRAGLSLTLVCSDSYYLFSEPNWWRLDPGIGVKRHAWYDEWNKSLGRPVDAKRSPVNNSQKNSNGTYSRAFDQGIVFYNPFGNSPQTLVFTKPVKSSATGLVSTRHPVGQGPDGDIFLLTQPGDPR